MENTIQDYIRELMRLLHCESTLQLFMVMFMSAISIYTILIMLIAYINPSKFNYMRQLYSQIGYAIGYIAIMCGSFVYEMVHSPFYGYIFILSIVIILDRRIIGQLGT